MPPPPGASPAAAAHRPRGLPAGRSRVRGMSVRHRPPAGVRGLAAVRELPGSASGARGLGGWVSGARARGPGRGPSAQISEGGKPLPRAGAGIYAWERPGVPAAGGGGFLPGGAARRAARRALAAPRDPGSGLRSRRLGFPGAGSAPALRLARCHRGRRLGLAARRGDARRGWFLGERRALPIKLPQEAKSKSQSPSLQTERHPISWERAPHRMTSRAYLSSRAEGRLSERSSTGNEEVEPASRNPYPEPPRANSARTPAPRPPTPVVGSWCPRFPAGSTSKRRRLLTWIPPSWELQAAGGRAAPAFPLSSGDAACNSEIKSPPNTSVVFKYSRELLPRQGPPRPRGGVEGDGGWQWREKKTPFFPLFFLLVLVHNPACHFLNPSQTTACERRLGEL
ncbi:uncharacterized protein LOC144330349 [Macaca mulatta]